MIVTRDRAVEALQRAEDETAVLSRVLNPQSVRLLRDALWDVRRALEDV